MKLPSEFTEKMHRLLGGDEYGEFIESFNRPAYPGLRVNTLRISVEKFIEITPFNLEKVPWTADGFYYSGEASPGRHPYYHAGLYYIQEPSAMFPGAILGAGPGECVLDLCAAPGGKTVQIAAGMQGQGLIVANDVNTERVKALVRNIELCGVRNAVVTNESPSGLAGVFGTVFDRVLVDAPCSGEGMFRKDRDAVRSWERYKCERCAAMQWEALCNADRMLKPGGYLVYSTCTFSPEENEKMISRFLDEYRCYDIADIQKVGGIEGGRPGWSDGRPCLAGTARLWPHRLKGEGHFAAKLRKNGWSMPGSGNSGKDSGSSRPYNRSNRSDNRINRPYNRSNGSDNRSSAADANKNAILKAFADFAGENLNTAVSGYFSVKGGNLYCLPVPCPCLDGIRVAKFGWYLGQFEKGRFLPSHSLALSLKKEEIRNTADFASDSREIAGYLKGETVMIGGTKGFTGVCVDGHTVGWAKQTGEMLKNLYPKGWRRER